jgi:hypothetical protein
METKDKFAEEIPIEVVTKMQREFEPHPDSTFKQGMYSGYAFGLQDGYKYHQQKIREELIKFTAWYNGKEGLTISHEQIDKYLTQKDK